MADGKGVRLLNRPENAGDALIALDLDIDAADRLFLHACVTLKVELGVEIERLCLSIARGEGGAGVAAVHAEDDDVGNFHVL